jgi:hypothetical protein
VDPPVPAGRVARDAGGDYWLQTGEFSWCAPRPTPLIAPPGAPPGASIPAGTVVCVGPPLASSAPTVPGSPFLGCRSGLYGPPEIRLLPGEVARVHLASGRHGRGDSSAAYGNA